MSVQVSVLAQQPEDGGVIAFLLSHDAAYVTGATIDVNGGFWMG